MRKNLNLICAGLMAMLLFLTSFKTGKQTPANRKAAPYQIEIDNNTTNLTILAVKVGSYATYTGLNLAPGNSATFGEYTPLSGSITVTVTCWTSWVGTIEYYEWDSEIACNNFTTSASAHSLTSVPASDVYFRLINVTSATGACINDELELK